MNIRGKLFVTLAATLSGAISLLLSNVAYAATATSNVTVTATVLAACTITGTTLAFPNYTPSNGTPDDIVSSAALTANCTSGTPATIGLGVGNNPTHAVGTTRAMIFGAAYLSYELYTNSPGGTVWNTTTNTLAYTGTGLATTVIINGRIPINQTAIAGAYSDTVVATITY